MSTTLGAVAEGSIVYLNESGVAVPFYVAKHDYEPALNGAGRTLLVRKDCYGTSTFNVSRTNAYANGHLDEYFAETWLPLLDSVILENAQTTKFYYTIGGGDYSVTTLDRTAFALSLTELGLSATGANVEGTAVPIASALRIAYLNGTATQQWTRSPNTTASGRAWELSTAGAANSRVTTSSRGARPALTLPAAMGVDDSGNVTQPKPAATSLANIDNTSVLLTGCIANVDGTEYAIPYALANIDGIEVVIPFGEQVSGTPVGDFDVGETVWMNVNGTPYEWIVVHQGKPSSLYDDSCNGTWLLMKDIYESRQWHSSNRNSYKASTIHTYLNGTFLNLFDADIKAQIKTVKIPYVNGTANAAVASGANGLPAQIFLLSGYEVGFTQSVNQYFPIDGSKLDYFVSGNDSTAKAKRIANMNGEAVIWWLRSQNTSGSSSARCVFTDGGYDGGGCSKSYGIRPALVLPADIMVDETGLIISSE